MEDNHNQERFRRHFETAKDGIVIADLEDGKVLDVNAYFLEWLGFDREEIAGNVIWSIPAWREAESAANLRLELERKGFVHHDGIPFRGKSDELFFAAIVGNAYMEGDRRVIQLNVRDVSERVRAQQALHASEERFRLFSENVTDYGMILTDREGKVVFWNSGAERVFGYPAAEAADRPAALIFTPEDRTLGEPEREMTKALRDGCADDERWHVRKDGSRFWASGVLTTVRDERGELRGFAKIVRDVTERKMAEDELARKADALARSNADLQQFAFVTSHDLQEPLRTILSYSQLLLERVGSRLSQSERDYVDFVIDAGNRMNTLIRDLLAYSRVVNVDSIPMENVDLDATAQWALMNLQLAIQDTRAQVTRDELPKVTGNQVQLVQVFQNLVGNAIKYRGNREPRIHISSQPQGQDWIISIEDNGIGVPAEYRERIFGLFKRLHGREVPGTGIGLTLCKKIVERHGGRIWVEEAAGGGSNFRFTVPQAIR